MINRGELGGRFDAPYYANRTFYKIKTIKLKYIAKIKGGKRIPKGKSYSQKITNFKYLRVDDIDSDGNIDLNSLKSISEDLYLFLKRYEVFENEIIISNAGTIGKIAILKQNNKHIILTENAVKLIKIDNNLYDDYLRIILNTKFVQEQMKQEYIQTTIPKLSIERISNLDIPILEQEKQQQIIDIMDNAYKQKKQKEKEAQDILDSIDDYLLSELGIILPEEPENTLENRTFQVEFEDVFNSRLDPLYYQYIKFNQITYNKSNIKALKLKKVAYISKGQSITKSQVDTDGGYPVIAGGKTSPYNHDKYNFKDFTITVSASGAYAGYVWFHDYPLFASDCNVIKSKNEQVYITKYIYEILRLQQQFIYKLQTGAGQPHIYPKDLENIKIFFPTNDYGEISIETQTDILETISIKRSQIKQLQQEAIEVVENAKQEVEKIILGDSYES